MGESGAGYLGGALGRSDWLSKTTRIRLPSGYADNLALARSIGRSNGDLGGANLCPHSLSSLRRRIGWGRESQTT